MGAKRYPANDPVMAYRIPVSRSWENSALVPLGSRHVVRTLEEAKS